MTNALRMIITGIGAALVFALCVTGGVLVLSLYGHTPRRKTGRTYHAPGYCERCGRTYTSAADITRAIEQGAIPDESYYHEN